MTATLVELAPGAPQLAGVWPVLRELRPQLDDEQMAARFATAAAERGLRLVAAFDAGACRALATYHLLTNMHLGRHCYVDDLVTSADHRSVGLGKQLLDHVVAVARASDCQAVRLDSGVQRHDAHRFYARERFDILAHSFVRRLP